MGWPHLELVCGSWPLRLLNVVAHEAGACTSQGDRGGRGRGSNPGRGSSAGRGSGSTTSSSAAAATSHARGLKTNVTKEAFKAQVSTKLQESNGSFGDNNSALVDALVNLMCEST